MKEKAYVNKNQYGYDIVGVIIDDENKIINYYSPCKMPIGRFKKASKKFIREVVELYQDAGYKTILH